MRTKNLGLSRSLLASIIATLAVLALPIAAHALTTLSQGYATSDDVTTGSIVSLKKTTNDQVVAASNANVNAILGVVINSDNSLLTLSNDKGSQVQVATSGILQVLVSDFNGTIKQGDQVTASPIAGVGMKATNNIKVVGIAQDDLTTHNSSQQSYKDKQGVKHNVRIGEIPVLINVSYYYRTPDKSLIPSTIQNIANGLAGRSVSPAPIIISVGIFLVTLIVVVSIIYSMIRSSIISVGRNPMSQSAIYRDLVQLSALVIGILGVGMVSIYLVLTRF